MTICLFVYLSAELDTNTTSGIFIKNGRMGLCLIQVPLNSESHPDHHLDTKNIKDTDFSIYL